MKHIPNQRCFLNKYMYFWILDTNHISRIILFGVQ
jgi:hypothetical protein